MTGKWSVWKRLPDAGRGERLEAPDGAGVYEVRSTRNGELVAFGHAGNVGQALAGVRAPASWSAVFGRGRPRSEELEYRFCSAPTKADAKYLADGFRNRRHAYWMWRLHGRRAA